VDQEEWGVRHPLEIGKMNCYELVPEKKTEIGKAKESKAGGDGEVSGAV